MRGMMFAIKAEVSDLRAETFAFSAQKTMYGGKQIAEGDTIYVFASENEGGPGLIASGVVTSAKANAKKRGIARQTPRVSIPSDAPRSLSAAWGGASSDFSPTGTTVDPRPSSTSNSIVRQRTRSLASRMKRRRSSADSFSATDFEMNTMWPNQALERTATLPGSFFAWLNPIPFERPPFPVFVARLVLVRW